MKKHIPFALALLIVIGCSLPIVSSVQADNCSIGTFTADKTSVLPSENVTITYFVSGCTKSSIVATDTVTGKVLRNLPDGTGSGGGSFALNGIENKTKIVFTVYSGTTAAGTKELTVEPKLTVTADPCTIISFAADKSTVVKGESTTLRWKTSTGCSSIEVTTDTAANFSGTQEGSITVSPQQTKTYYLFVSKLAGADFHVGTVAITVTEPPAPAPVPTPTPTPTPTPAPIEQTPQLPITSPGFPEPAPAPETATPTQDSPFYTYSVGGNNPSGVAFNNPGWSGGDAIGGNQVGIQNGVGFGAGQGDPFGSSGESNISFLDWLTGKKKKDKQKLDPLQTIVISDPKLADTEVGQGTTSGPTVATGGVVTPAPVARISGTEGAQMKKASLFDALKTFFDRLLFWR